MKVRETALRESERQRPRARETTTDHDALPACNRQEHFVCRFTAIPDELGDQRRGRDDNGAARQGSDAIGVKREALRPKLTRERGSNERNDTGRRRFRDDDDRPDGVLEPRRGLDGLLRNRRIGALDQRRRRTIASIKRMHDLDS